MNLYLGKLETHQRLLELSLPKNRRCNSLVHHQKSNINDIQLFGISYSSTFNFAFINN
jgi:hypothetical protein